MNPAPLGEVFAYGRRSGTSRWSLFEKEWPMTDTGTDAPKIRIVPPLVYLAGLVAGLIVTAWIPTQAVAGSIAWPVGVVLVLCGIALAASAISRFSSAGTTIRPDRAASQLVIAGPYRLSRNPMYVGLAAVYLGIAIGTQSLWALLLLPVVLTIIRRRVIEREEAFLERRFGTPYRDYRTRVRRWL
jgi:protein-S-isoprenylcysteine O-methyltransferase Ste14